MKNKQYDGALAALCIFLYLAIGCGIAALCVVNCEVALLGFALKYVLAVACGACLLVYLVVLIVCVAKKHGKRMLGLSVTIVIGGTFIIALSPLALLVWIFQLIIESAVHRRSRSAKTENI